MHFWGKWSDHEVYEMVSMIVCSNQYIIYELIINNYKAKVLRTSNNHIHLSSNCLIFGWLAHSQKSNQKSHHSGHYWSYTIDIFAKIIKGCKLSYLRTIEEI